MADREFLIRQSAYRGCLDSGQVFDGLTQVLLRNALFDGSGQPYPAGAAIRKAILDCIPGAVDLFIEPGEFRLIVEKERQGALPIDSLSSGQRSVLAIVGDLAQRMVRLNPQLGADALTETPGVVLMDVLDLHLHPEWQRELPDRLRTIFPKVQFIATTHSPFVIQAMRPEETHSLKGQAPATVGNLSVEEIAAGVMGVEHPEVSRRYREMLENAKRFLQKAEEISRGAPDGLPGAGDELGEMLRPYASDPATPRRAR